MTWFPYNASKQFIFVTVFKFNGCFKTISFLIEDVYIGMNNEPNWFRFKINDLKFNFFANFTFVYCRSSNVLAIINGYFIVSRCTYDLISMLLKWFIKIKNEFFCTPNLSNLRSQLKEFLFLKNHEAIYTWLCPNHSNQLVLLPHIVFCKYHC